MFGIIVSNVIFLVQISDQEHLGTLSEGCSLTDMLRYDDTDQDSLLSVNEFYAAFSKLYSKFKKKRRSSELSEGSPPSAALGIV